MWGNESPLSRRRLLHWMLLLQLAGLAGLVGRLRAAELERRLIAVAPALRGVAALVVAGLAEAGFALLALNTVGNLASKSRSERMLMTPIAGVCAVCFLLVALSD